MNLIRISPVQTPKKIRPLYNKQYIIIATIFDINFQLQKTFYPLLSGQCNATITAHPTCSGSVLAGQPAEH